MSGNVRPETMARITTKELALKFINEQIKIIKKQVGNKKFYSLYLVELTHP